MLFKIYEAFGLRRFSDPQFRTEFSSVLIIESSLIMDDMDASRKKTAMENPMENPLFIDGVFQLETSISKGFPS